MVDNDAGEIIKIKCPRDLCVHCKRDACLYIIPAMQYTILFTKEDRIGSVIIAIIIYKRIILCCVVIWSVLKRRGNLSVNCL